MVFASHQLSRRRRRRHPYGKPRLAALLATGLCVLSFLVTFAVAIHHKDNNNNNNNNNYDDDSKIASSTTQHGRRLQPNVQGNKYRLWIHYIDGHDELVQQIVGTNNCQIHYDFPDTHKLVVTVDLAGYDMLEADARVDVMDADSIRQMEEMPDAYHDLPDVLADIRKEEGRHKDSRRRLQQVMPYGIGATQAPVIWDKANKGAGVKVCVMDSGMYGVHEDFDFSRFDGETVNAQNDASYPWNLDGDSHGTHVTGTIAALSNDIGVVGVAPDVDVHVVRVFDDEADYIWGSSVVSAAWRCQQAGARVINMSLGGPGWSTQEGAEFEALLDLNVLSIAAAGNTGTFTYRYPSSYSAVMSVAAVNSSENLASFSTRNDQVEIAAPGVAVYSTMNSAPPDSYGYKSGTSMATPHVSGVAALLMAARPHATARQVREALQLSAKDVGADGRDSGFGYGLLRASDALGKLDEIAPPPATENPTMAPILLSPPTEEATDGPSMAPSFIQDERCPIGQHNVIVDVSLSDASETKIEIVRDDEWIAFSKDDYFDDQRTVHTRCYDLTRCWVLNVLDSGGDGLPGRDVVRLVISDKILLEAKGDFGSVVSTTFGNCPTMDKDKECPPDRTLVEITVRTDDTPEGITTQIIRGDYKPIQAKDNYLESRVQKVSRCLNTERHCYTFSAFDTSVAGLVSPGYVKLEIDNEEKLFESGLVPGAMATHTFGQCEYIPKECPTGRDLITIRVFADGQGADLTTKIVRRDEFVVFERAGFDDNRIKVMERCLNLNRCFRFNVTDAGGNGLVAPGYVSLDINTVEVYRMSQFGSMGVHEFGDCSPPEDKVCTNPKQELVEVVVRTDDLPETIITRITREDGNVVFEKNNYRSERVDIRQRCINTVDYCYDFVILDSQENGLESPGYVRLDVGDQTVLTDADFGQSTGASFGNCPSNTASSGHASCGEGQDQLRLVLQTDDKGVESAVRIIGNGELLETHHNLDSNSEYVFETCADAGGCYNIEITDTGHDGICCSNGNGYASFYVNDELREQASTFGTSHTFSTSCYTLD